MSQSRFARYAPLTGIIAVFLMMVGAGLFGVYEYLPPAESLEEYFNANPARVSAAGYFGTLSAFFMLWFVGSLYPVLRENEGGDGRVSVIAFGGGVASGVALAIGFTIMIATGSRAGASGGISPVEAVTLYDLYGQILGGTMAFTLAVLIGGSGIVALRSGMFKSWAGWASALIAFGLLTPLAYAVLALALVWLFAVSIWLFRRGPISQLA